MKKPIILIDGSSYFHRAYHALPPLTTTKGEPTGAIYGVINMIKKIMKDYNPEYIAVIFDAKGKNFRHELYPEYKATRPQMPDDLVQQIKPLHETIKAMGLTLISIAGVEADDVIGTLAKKATSAKIPVVISTGDKDFAQLVNEHIILINTMSNTVLDTENVVKKFGVPPEKIIDYLTLVGDTSDNIPGVPNIGPKTAVKLLTEYGSLDEIVKHAHEIKGKMGENLQKSLDYLPLAKKLVTIKDDVELNLELADLKKTAPDNTKLAELFQHLEFKIWRENLAKNGETSSETTKKFASENINYHTIFTEEDFLLWLNKLQKAHSFAFDLETTSLEIINAKIVGISFALEIGEAIYIPIGHTYENAPKQLDSNFVLQKLKPLFENPHLKKLGQNLKYDMSVLANYAINLLGISFDTMLESYVLNSAVNQHDKGTLALKFLSKEVPTFEDIAGKGAKQLTSDQILIENLAPYAASDSDIVLQLHHVLWSELQKYPKLVAVLQNIEIPLLSVLAKMEQTGVHLDVNLLSEQSKELTVKLRHFEDEVYKIAGEVFNLNSPLQLQEILFTKLKLPVLQKTPKGQPSTGEQTLQELALDYPLPALILEYRSLSKLKSTYTDSLPLQINPKTNRIHTSYNQAVTTTGRLSSTNPNLQNIPIRTEEGRRIRKAFIAEKHHKIISADYSQIELRVMAHLSKDLGLLEAFATDSDIHKRTAAEIFQIPLEKVTTAERQSAKMINFGLIYGMSPFGLAKRLGLSREFAGKYITSYFQHYPGVKTYIENMRETAKKQGFVETMFGRRLYTPEINSKNFPLRNAAERTAINAPIQGSAADIMKIAMINIADWLKTCDLNIKMIMQVHDELIFEVLESDAPKALPKIKHLMENAAKLAVPITTNVGIGDNWDEAH
jgi:DNA polymerase I